MYTEFNYIQLSALQHYIFCPRQCALAYIELNWEENHLTAQGHLMHESVHSAGKEKRRDRIQSRGMYISSKKYGLSGQCDLVEFYRVEDVAVSLVETKDVASLPSTLKFTKLPNRAGWWIPFPVEYKRGKPKKDNCDTVQLCAQALCLEEMLNCRIDAGAIYYGTQHHRMDVDFDTDLRHETEEVIHAVHDLFVHKTTPKPNYTAKCRNCSLLDRCRPKQFEHHRKRDYIDEIFNP
jgi:CRISPR-associated exonuclease Cas4